MKIDTKTHVLATNKKSCSYICNLHEHLESIKSKNYGQKFKTYWLIIDLLKVYRWLVAIVDLSKGLLIRLHAQVFLDITGVPMTS